MTLQDAKRASIQKTAEVEAFELQNMAAASAKTTAAIAEQGVAEAEKATQRVDVEASGYAIQMNEDRARTVKVSAQLLADLQDRFNGHLAICILFSCLGTMIPDWGSS